MNADCASRRPVGGRKVAAWVAALGVACSGAAAADAVRLVVAEHVAPDGTLAGPVAIEIERGRIVSVETPGEDEAAIDGVLAPGVIDVFSGVGVGRRVRDDVKPIADDITALDAIDPLHPSFAEAAAAGITTALVAPAPTNPVSGVAVAVSTHAEGGALDVLNEASAMVLSLGPPAVDTRYGPTSRAGILFAIRSAMDAAEGEGELARVAEGALPAVAFCPDGDDAAQAIQTLGGFGLSPSIVHSTDALELAEDLGGYGGAFVVGPYGVGAPPEVLAGAGFLERAGVRVVIHGGTADRSYDSIRTTAALATGYGLAPEAARRSFTTEAARLAGIDDETGAIREGLRADLVLWTGDPLHVASRPLKVWVRGELLHDHPVAGTTGEGSTP